MLSLLHFTSFVLNLVLNLFLIFIILVVILVIVLKVWTEPVKGVCRCKTKLDGKIVLVTGGNSGIGLETARDLARRGARVIIACRNSKKSELAINDIIKTTGNPNIEFRYLDLSKFKSIRDFSEDFNKSFDRLDILVNNAGCASRKICFTEDGIDLVTQINYVGAYLLTNLLLDKIIASKPSRIVIVSSIAHFFNRFDVNDLKSEKKLSNIATVEYWYKYANSKLCQLLWMKALARKLPDGVAVNALHPGVVNTDIWEPVPWPFKEMIVKIISLIFKTAAEGAQTTIHLCVAPELANSSGGFYWDCKPAEPLKMCTNEKLIEKVWNDTQLLINNSNSVIG